MTRTSLRTATDLTGTGTCVAFTLRKATRVVTQLYDAALLESGLRSTQLAILTAVAKYEPISVGELADLTVCDSTTMTRGLKLLESRGWLRLSERSVKRQKLVALTPSGRRTLTQGVASWRRIQAEFVGKYGAGDWERVRQALERLGQQARVHAAHQRRSRSP